MIIEKKKTTYSARKVDAYRLVEETDYSKILKYLIENDSDIHWILQLILDNDPIILKYLSNNERNNLEKSFQITKDSIEFVTLPFEEFTKSQKENFKKLKLAVKNHEYRTILYNYTKGENLINVKCLKVLFISNNWYLAIEIDNQLRLLRIAFIQEIDYSIKDTYQKSILNKYNDYFNSIQNAFTLPNVKKEKVVLQVSPEKAKYFLPNMKVFFKSQRFIKQNEQGFVDISIEYTQSLEILPFIKQWLPHIRILEPKELINELKQDLSHYLGECDSLYFNT